MHKLDKGPRGHVGETRLLLWDRTRTILLLTMNASVETSLPTHLRLGESLKPGIRPLIRYRCGFLKLYYAFNL